MQAEIQIQFPAPGVWDQFTMTAVFADAEGYVSTPVYTWDDIPLSMAPAFAGVVAAIVALQAPWVARRVWVRETELRDVEDSRAGGGYVHVWPALALEVEAVREDGGTRLMTARDCPALLVQDVAAVEFFRHFATPR